MSRVGCGLIDPRNSAGRAIELAGKTVLARIARGKRDNGDRGFEDFTVVPAPPRRPAVAGNPGTVRSLHAPPDKASGAAVITFGLSARHARPSSAAKAAVARLIGTDGAEEVNLAKCRPQHIRKVELTVHALPKKET